MRRNLHAQFLAVTGALALGWPGLGLNPAAMAAESLTAEAGSQRTQWTLSYQGKPVMVYVFDPQKFKPYVKELNTLKGYGVLRDAPEDHLHHHALMYGIKVNGINFWEETAGCGVEKVVETSVPETSSTTTGQPSARLVQTLFWLSPEDAFFPNAHTQPLLIERRTLTLTLNTNNQETALHWRSEFEVGSKTGTVTLTGFNYHGLGMRFLKELDALAVHFTSAGQLGVEPGKQVVSAFPWEAVAFDPPGKPATIALFGGPDNGRGASRFFSMLTPFAYLSATQGLDREPLVYHRGEHFELNYLIAIYPEVKTVEALANRNRSWVSSAR